MAGGSSRIARLARALVLLALALAVGFGSGTLAARLTQPSQAEQPPTAAAAYTLWDQDACPNYYRVAGTAVVGEQPEPGSVAYGELDSLGRTTGVVATITRQAMEQGLARTRGDMSALEPSGWGHNAEVDIAMPDGSVYHGFLYNRSHLVAKSLGGDDEVHNLMTGTRTQNVGANVDGTEGGMAYAEGLARTWLFGHPDGTLYYAVTPVYAGNDLLARSVIVDMRSSDGTLDQRIEVYNAARGFAIDYATGAFEVTEDAQEAARQIRAAREGGATATSVQRDAPVADAPEATRPQAQGTPESEDGERKVIVTGSGKAYHHDESCNGLANARSMRWVSVSEAEEMGRHPCGICGG